LPTASGLPTLQDALETEKELVKHIPSELLSKAHHWLILHGRYICVARKPKCGSCGLAPYCQYHEKQSIFH